MVRWNSCASILKVTLIDSKERADSQLVSSSARDKTNTLGKIYVTSKRQNCGLIPNDHGWAWGHIGEKVEKRKSSLQVANQNLCSKFGPVKPIQQNLAYKKYY